MNIKDLDNAKQLQNLDSQFNSMMNGLDGNLDKEKELEELLDYHADILIKNKKTTINIVDTDYLVGYSLSKNEKDESIIVLFAFDYIQAKIVGGKYLPATAIVEYNIEETELDNVKRALEGWLRYKLDIILPEEL